MTKVNKNKDRVKEIKIALAMIVAPTDEEAICLNRLLENVKPHVDAMYITITGKNEHVQKVCENHKANISYYDWDYNFANARNYNFKQVPKEYDYILWADADDMFRHLDKLKSLMKKYPADVYSMFYYYDFDPQKNPTVVHQKTQIVKNDECVEWAGALHEDFKENRELTRYFIKGVHRLHLTDKVRYDKAIQRNLVISEKDMKKHPDDPRSYWNLGNSQKTALKITEAIKTFGKFLEMSKSEEEKYVASLRLAECYWGLDKHKAIEIAQNALGLKPDYPDAYHLLGSLNFELQRFEKAAKYYLQGLTKKPPYHSILVYNPRDYDYNPMMNLAKCYYNLNQPSLALPMLEGCAKIYPKDKGLKNTIKVMKKEAKQMEDVIEKLKKLSKIKDKSQLKKAIDNLDPKIRQHPAICHLKNINFVKKTSSGKDISIYCGYTTFDWDPGIADKKGVGGSEEAVINLAKIWAKFGWNVTVFNSCGHKAKEFDGVTYKPFWSWNYRDKTDVTILWRTPRPVEYGINTTKLYVDLHDVISSGEFSEERLKDITKIFVKSSFHRKLFENVPDNKFVVVPNGLHTDIFKKGLDKIKRDPYLLINTSSADRSLKVLVKLFKEVKKQVPQAKLKWAYGWGVWDSMYADDTEKNKWKEDLIKDMEDAGVENLGRVGHDTVNDLYMQARVYAYPSEFAEIDCMSISKSLAAGCLPATTDFAAMGDKKLEGGVYLPSNKTKTNWAPPYKFDFSLENENVQKMWVDAVVKILKEPINEEELNAMQQKAWNKYDWERIAKVWEDEFNAKNT